MWRALLSLIGVLSATFRKPRDVLWPLQEHRAVLDTMIDEQRIRVHYLPGGGEAHTFSLSHRWPACASAAYT
jgi:hypothetical protein